MVSVLRESQTNTSISTNPGASQFSYFFRVGDLLAMTRWLKKFIATSA
jgi:hypothetical protein